MSTIRCIYQEEPNFPATDQHPGAKRYYFWLDGSVTEAVLPSEVEAEQIVTLNQGETMFLRRLSGESRATFIEGTGKDRFAVMSAAQKPLHVVDALDGMPTLEAIEIVLNPPAPPREASAADLFEVLKTKGMVTDAELAAVATKS